VAHHDKAGHKKGRGRNQGAAKADGRQHRTDKKQRQGKADEGGAQHGAQHLAGPDLVDGVEIIGAHVHGSDGAKRHGGAGREERQ